MPERSLTDRLVSPHGFDGRGPVPDEVRTAAERIAQLRVKFLTRKTLEPLTAHEVAQLFDAAALQAEWMRELYEALHPEGRVDEEA